MKHEIVLGKKKIFFDTPTNFNTTNVISAKQNPISDIESATKKSLSLPINSKLLSELAKGKSDACIVVTDITRSCPDNKLLPPIIEDLEKEIDQMFGDDTLTWNKVIYQKNELDKLGG